MIECLTKEFLMYFGRLQHRRTAGCLWPDGGSRALEATQSLGLVVGERWQPGLVPARGARGRGEL